MNEVAILNTVFTVKTSGLDIFTSPSEKNISGFSVHTIPDSQRIQKFPFWRADSKRYGFVCQFHLICVDGSRIQKYPDTCG